MLELEMRKVKVTKDMLDQDILIPVKNYSKWEKLKNYEKYIVRINKIGKHNISRHNLFWACVSIVEDNSELTETQIVETCKIDCRHIRGFCVYKDKNGNERYNVITKSISFFEMGLDEADQFYKNAFKFLASYIGITEQKLIEEAKEKMK